MPVILALLLLLGAAPPKKPPPAQLVVPKELREQRERELEVVDPKDLPLFANPKLAAALGAFQPLEGAWVEYLVQQKGEQGIRLRATVLPPSKPERYWLELDTVGQAGVAGATKLLVHGNAFRLKDIERAYVMLAGQHPLDLPLDELDVPEQKEPLAPPKVKQLGKGAVKVRAGSFQAEALQVQDTKIWRSAEVPLWGLVKAQGPRDSIELLSFGKSGGHSIFPPGWGESPEKPAQGNGSESTK